MPMAVEGKTRSTNLIRLDVLYKDLQSLHIQHQSLRDCVPRSTPINSLKMIVGLAHVNLIVPSGTLEKANEFYGNTLGLTNRPVPHLQKDRLAWFDIGSSGQQVHIAFGPSEVESSRHPCFKIESPEKLLELQKKVWEHHERQDGSSPRAADKPGEANSGTWDAPELMLVVVMLGE